MRIGFATIYSWRPHVEHLYFLATLAAKAGHEVHFLTCNADLPSCYARELRGRPAWQECLLCRVGGVRSFTNRNVSSIGRYVKSAATPCSVPREWAQSSASTLGRYESDSDYASPEFHALAARLQPAVQMTYDAACKWMTENRLEAICIFNGRIDVTRAIYEAARAMGIRVVSLERTWFGDGLQLYPDESCLGLHSVHALMTEWRDRPLTAQQALKSASHIAGRFLRNNIKEWRAYNAGARPVDWPIKESKHRILLIPSSRNEVWGHADWISGWGEPIAAYDAIMARFRLDPTDVVLRCHPNWGEKIGKRDGKFSERYYSDWAVRRGVKCIGSTDTASTLSLVAQCDAIVVANGSAALEAGILGKQVIGTAPSIYQEGGFRDSACNPLELDGLRLHKGIDTAERELLARHIARQTLRFCYTMVYRIPQYTRFVKADATTKYRYDFSASPRRFIELLRTGKLRADDDTFAESVAQEDAVLDRISGNEWSWLSEALVNEEGQYEVLRRRPMLRVIDWVSKRKPVGDR